MRTTLKRPLIECVSAELAVPARPSTFREGRRFQFLDPNGNEIAIWSDDA
jgi:predicted enzyme related to lactoylglutathione lyase